MQHSVSLPAGTFLEELLEKEELLVNSIYTQFLELSAILSDEKDDNEGKIEICAITEDNIAGYNYITIEAFLVKDTNFALAVKWHPELIDDDKNKIFGYFSDKCKEYFHQKNNY